MRNIKLILFSLIVGYSQSSYAQKGYEAAIVAGLNFSQVDGDQMSGYNKAGLNVGIAISRPIKAPWSASFEILYAQKGAKKVIDPDNPQPTLLLNYHYVEVPLLARYEYEKFQFFGGASLGINVFNQRDDNGFVTQEQALQKIETALHLGLTYRFGERFGADLRHSYSLLSIRDFPIVINSPTWFGRAGWYNRVFSVGLRYDLGS